MTNSLPVDLGERQKQLDWIAVCKLDDLIPGSGVCVRFGRQQAALFYLPDEPEQVFAVGNWDPKGGANVISRGILGDINNTLVVASPLYKEHYALHSGCCLEDDNVALPVFEVKISEQQIWLKTS